MKNLFLCVILALFAVAWTATRLDRNVRDIEISRTKRQIDFGNWFQTNKDSKKKDDKKKKGKNKKHTTTAKPTPTIASTTVTPIATSPTSAKPLKIPDDVLKKILKMKSRDELDKYMGVTKDMRMKMKADYIKQLPKDLAQAVVRSQSTAGNSDDTKVCHCTPTYTRIFLEHEHNPPLGIFYPNNCVGTFRCGGGCMYDELQECVPKEIKVITHTVLYYYLGFIGGRAPIVQQKQRVEHHKSCECRCKPKQCHARQVFVEGYCSCRCKPEYSRANLRCSGQGTPLEYDEDTCSCKCPFSQGHCRNSQVWDQKLCKCTCPRCPSGMIQGKDCKCSIIKMSNLG